MSIDQTNLIQQVRQAADEVRLKLHLAGMDAKDAWAKVEPRLRAFEHKAESATDKIAAELTDAGQELKRDLTKLLEQLRSS